MAFSIEAIANNVVDFLKNRHHPERPHISVLAPPPLKIYQQLWQRCCYIEKEEVVEGEDEDEESVDIEDVELSMRSRTPGWVFGADFDFDQTGEEGKAHINYSFYIRLGFDYDEQEKWNLTENNYAKIDINATLSTNSLHISINYTQGENKSPPIEKDINDVGNCQFYIIPILHKEVAGCLNSEFLMQLAMRIVSLRLGKTMSKALSNYLKINNIIYNISPVIIEIIKRKNKYNGLFYHAFALLIGYCNGTLKTYLLNLGGIVKGDSEVIRKVCERPQRIYIENPNDGSRWVIGHLLEVEGSIRFFGGWSSKVDWGWYGIGGAYPINSLIIKEEDRFILRDYDIKKEELEPIKKGSKGVEEFLKDLMKELGIKCDNKDFQNFIAALASALKEDLKVDRLYTYQEDAARSIISSILSDKVGGQGYRAISIMARTAGGKTYAFLIPILIYIGYTKLCSKEGAQLGVKALLTYPTKALANDQVEEISHILYYLFSKYFDENNKPLITFGVLHGNVPYKQDMLQSQAQGEPLPLSCPIHKGHVYMSLKDNNNIEVVCERGGANCGFAQFVQKAMRKVRDEVYYEPPDILVTDEDMINRILSGVPNEHISEVHNKHNGSKRALWYELQLFGFEYKRCDKCMHTYPANLGIKKCKVCGAELNNQVIRVSRPKIVVLDEAHQIHGSFGVQVHHLLSLFEQVLGEKPIYVVSSATLAKSEDFIHALLRVRENEIKIIKAEVDKNAVRSPLHRVFVFLMPKSYTRDATAVRVLEELLRAWHQLRSRSNPKGIIFTNTLAESNELIQSIRNSKEVNNYDVKVDGHSTDYNEERAQKEVEFKQGKIDWFVATSTLELGVDYGAVDFVLIYGMPRRIQDFVQRIGRAGRGRDALVFVVFNPDLPLDYSFYENYRLLYDDALRTKAIEHEVVVVSPMNEEAVKRAVKRWFMAQLKLMCSQRNPDACKIIAGTLEDKSNAQVAQAWEKIINYFKQNVIMNMPNPLPESLRSIYPFYENLIKNQLDQIISSVENNKNNLRSIKDTISYLGGQELLYNLRASDEEITINFPQLVIPGQAFRKRELRYVIKHGFPGQVISYRGFFFFVKDASASYIQLIDDWLTTKGDQHGSQSKT